MTSSCLPHSVHERRAPLKHWVRICCLSILSCLATGLAIAQGFPSRPVRIVVPSSAGGPADILGRLVAERLSKAWAQPVLIDNKPGAALMIGSELVAKAPPDGYTLLLTPDGPITINPALYPKMSYDPQKDLLPVARVVNLPLILVVHPAVPATTVAELVALAKANPGKLNYAAGGSTSRIAAELFKRATGIETVHIPYKGSGAMVNAVVGGEAQLAFDGITSSVGQVRAGRLRALAVTGRSRVSFLPDVPTVAESGLAPGYEAGAWLGFFAPAGTPRDVVEKIGAELSRVLAQPDLRERLAEMGMTMSAAGSQEFAGDIRREAEKWAQLIKRAGITADN